MFLILLLIGSSGFSLTNPLTETVDAIELNTKYDHEGAVAFQQIIFWEWLPDYCRQRPLSWVLLDNTKVNIQRYGGFTTVYWLDSNGKRKVVRSKTFRRTWTDEDPERESERLDDEKFRIGLRKGKL